MAEDQASGIMFYSRVVKIEQKKRLARSWKTGRKTEDGKDEIQTEHEDRGWFILLEGSWESIHIGDHKPNWVAVGDEVEVIIRRKS